LSAVKVFNNLLTKKYNFIQEMANNTLNNLKVYFSNPLTYFLLPIFKILLIVFLASIVLNISDRLIKKIFAIGFKGNTGKIITIQKLTKSIITYTTYFLALLMILINLGINPIPLLAGAGIAGIMFGFGAQNLIKDFVSGFFLILEDQLEVGDLVEINNQVRGRVEEVGLKTTKIREESQKLHYIPNGNIMHVINYNRGEIKVNASITIAYEENIQKVIEALDELCRNINNTYKEILLAKTENLKITGIEKEGFTFTIAAVTKPSNYEDLENILKNELAKQIKGKELKIANT